MNNVYLTPSDKYIVGLAQMWINQSNIHENTIERRLSEKDLDNIQHRIKYYEDFIGRRKRLLEDADPSKIQEYTEIVNSLESQLSEKKARFNQVKDGIGIPFKDMVSIDFQFPPKVTEDSKNPKWAEEHFGLSEPIAIYMGAGARAVKLKFSYIVTDDDRDWDISKISSIVKSLRGMFYNMAGSDVLIALRYYSVIGDSDLAQDPDYWTFRVSNMGISHSDVQIVNSDGKVFPLRTDVTLDLLSWTNVVDKELSIKFDPKIGGLQKQQVQVSVSKLNYLPSSDQKGWF